jgi:hypothetical protein
MNRTQLYQEKLHQMMIRPTPKPNEKPVPKPTLSQRIGYLLSKLKRGQ